VSLKLVDLLWLCFIEFIREALLMGAMVFKAQIRVDNKDHLPVRLSKSQNRMTIVL
jgi:hypothetical protein